MLKRNPLFVLVSGVLFSLVLSLFLTACSPEPAPEEPKPISLEPSIEQELQPVHPDEPTSHTFNQRFSLENALDRVAQIEDIGTPEIQGEISMGFTNAISAVNGTLLKQDYELKKAEFDLAKFEHRDNLITDSDLAEKESAYNEAVEAFKTFWGSFGISD